MANFLAIDIGASSGRHVVGQVKGGEMTVCEVYRFQNGIVQQDGRLTWDIESLYNNVVLGIAEAFHRFGTIDSLSIDTWGVDYVLMQNGTAILPVYSYRDSRTTAATEKVHSIIPFERLYSITGCQFQPFNSIYQLYCDKEAGRLDKADCMLMIPEYLMYRLCGVKAREYTNATTTGMINAKTGEFDKEIIAALGLPQKLFPALSAPGTVLGNLIDEVAAKVGGNTKVVLCATHDTGSAVEGIPMEGNAPYISSGTWSLLGVKTQKPITTPAGMAANYSNEGGVGYNRFQKNIMGMWLVNRLRDDLCPDTPFDEIVKAAERSYTDITVDANDSIFLAPESMKSAFDTATGGKLQTVGDYFRCAYLSLAESYRVALEEMEVITGENYDRLYIVGGGAKNRLLNQMTQEAIGRKVIALPIEATALGNLKILSEVK